METVTTYLKVASYKDCERLLTETATVSLMVASYMDSCCDQLHYHERHLLAASRHRESVIELRVGGEFSIGAI